MKCARCGKEFRVGPGGWGYAYGGLYTCSYSCMRAMEREDVKNMLPDDQKQQVDLLYAAGKPIKEIAEALGADFSSVRAYIAGQSEKNKAMKQKAKAEESAPEAAGVPDDVKALVVSLIQDMLDVLKKLYGI